jgi:hypothetical protein
MGSKESSSVKVTKPLILLIFGTFPWETTAVPSTLKIVSNAAKKKCNHRIFIKIWETVNLMHWKLWSTLTETKQELWFWLFKYSQYISKIWEWDSHGGDIDLLCEYFHHRRIEYVEMMIVERLFRVRSILTFHICFPLMVREESLTFSILWYSVFPKSPAKVSFSLSSTFMWFQSFIVCDFRVCVEYSATRWTLRTKRVTISDFLV